MTARPCSCWAPRALGFHDGHCCFADDTPCHDDIVDTAAQDAEDHDVPWPSLTTEDDRWPWIEAAMRRLYPPVPPPPDPYGTQPLPI